MKLNEYIETVGIPAFAALIRVTPAFVYQLKKGARPVPSQTAVLIEQKTSGNLWCEELRPDLKWVRVPDDGWPYGAGRPLLDMTSGLDISAGNQPTALRVS